MVGWVGCRWSWIVMDLFSSSSTIYRQSSLPPSCSDKHSSYVDKWAAIFCKTPGIHVDEILAVAIRTSSSLLSHLGSPTFVVITLITSYTMHVVKPAH